MLALGWGIHLHAKHAAHRLATGVRVRHPPDAPSRVPSSARERADLSDEGGGMGHVEVDLAVHEYCTDDFGRAGARSGRGGAEGSFHV